MTTNCRHPNVVNVEEVEAVEQGKGKLGSRRKRLDAAAGGAALGCTYLEVAPGKTAFPFHFHSAFEEALFILEGEGAARIGKETVAVRTGDYLVFPAGPATPHALANTGTAPLRYLALSSPATPATMDIVVYPGFEEGRVRLGRRSRQGVWRRDLGHEPDQGRPAQARLLRRRAVGRGVSAVGSAGC